MADYAADVLMANEAELYVEQLRIFELKDVGNPQWLKQHEFIEKLNVQSHLNISTDREEFVMELLISYDKIPLLVHEALLLEVWREKVHPQLQKLEFAAKSTMVPYIVFYHEATIINLLELILYNKEACEAASDCMVDLIDYTYRGITYLSSRTEEDDEKDREYETKTAASTLDEDGEAQLNQQIYKLPFERGVKCVSIFRYITDHLKALPLSCMTRILNTLDMPSALVALVTNQPFERRRDGKSEKFFDGKWTVVPPSDRMLMTKTEGQVWLSLYNLMLEPDCRRKYQFNTFNKNELLKLRGFLNDVTIDQLPMLAELRRTLEELSMMDPPDPEPSVVLEQLPEVRDQLLRANDGKYTAIADYQMKQVFSPSKEKQMAQAKMLSDVYNLDTLESMFPEAPKCAVCGEPAANRCSRCANEWYCRRQCQVDHWKKHKKVCDMIANAKASQ